MKLSVIISAYNVQPYLRDSLQSVLRSTFQDFELLIADDGSSDATRQIIDSFSDDRIIIDHNKQNLGKTNTVNRLFQMCRGISEILFAVPGHFCRY